MQPSDVVNPQDLVAVYQQWGWIGVAAACVYALLRAWRSGYVDLLLAAYLPGLRWGERSRRWRFVIVFVLSVGATALAGVAQGQAWWVALLAGLALGFPSAVGLHESVSTATKAANEDPEPPTVTPGGRELGSLRTRLPPTVRTPPEQG